MRAKIYINRHLVAQNKKAKKENLTWVELPEISVNTYLGVKYCKKIDFTEPASLLQDYDNPACSGAHIYLEVANAESLIVDDRRFSKNMIAKKRNKR